MVTETNKYDSVPASTCKGPGFFILQPSLGISTTFLFIPAPLTKKAKRQPDSDQKNPFMPISAAFKGGINLNPEELWQYRIHPLRCTRLSGGGENEP